MPAESKAAVRLAIGHVLFIDIVGYSKLLISEQSELLGVLNDMVREAGEFRSAEADGRLMRLPTGDGMALVFRDSPEQPVRCALEISQALKNYPKLQVRMGIHSGPVNEVADVNERANIAGAGINVAQRVFTRRVRHGSFARSGIVPFASRFRAQDRQIDRGASL